MKIYLLRHGQIIDANPRQSNPCLSAKGLCQAELLGQRLQSYSLEAIYSSDLERAKQTTHIINRHTRTDIVFKSQLREIDMGEIPENGWEAFPEYYKEWQKQKSDLPYPGGETGQDVQKRAWEVIEEILDHYTQAVAVVTHGGVIMVLLSACLGLGLEKRFQFMPMANCSISTLTYDPEKQCLKVEQVNDTAHLGSE
jgi:probable phosphoglycerate mutase